MDKLLLTLTNLFILWPVFHSTIWRDTCSLLLASLLSLVHHATEVRYYPPALLSSEAWQRDWFLAGDRAGAVQAMLLVGRLALLKDQLPLVMLAFSCMLLSEAVMFLFALKTAVKLRTLLHCVWHFLAEGYLPYLAVTRYRETTTLYQLLVL